jgi:hypothetical protein
VEIEAASAPGEQAHHRALTIGDVLNARGILGQSVSDWTATAVTGAKLLCLGRDAMDRLARYHPFTAAKLLRNLLILSGKEGVGLADAPVPGTALGPGPQVRQPPPTPASR